MARVTATTTKTINLPQLSSEMGGAAVGGPDGGDWYNGGSKLIWADGVTQSTLDNAIAAHTADQSWGYTPGDGAIPVGMPMPFAGATAPPGWLLCDGTSHLRTAYPMLFAIVGTAYGAADGTHFNVPDLRDRMILGASAGRPRGTTGGALGHTHTGPAGHSNHAVTQPSNHAVTQPGAHNDHSVTQPGAHAVTQPGAHSNHAVTQPGAHSNHAVTQPADHTGVPSHSHGEQVQGGTTASTTGTNIMTSASTGGSLRTAGQSTLGPTPPAANQVHSATAVDAHSAHSGAAVDAHSAHSGTAVDAHAGTAVNAHSAHSGAAVDAHAGAAVDAHSAHGATGAADPPFVAMPWIIRAT